VEKLIVLGGWYGRRIETNGLGFSSLARIGNRENMAYNVQRQMQRKVVISPSIAVNSDG
jgi:hypothetical protein